MAAMSETTPQGQGNQVPWGMLGMLGMLCAIEFGLARNELSFKHCFTYDWVVTGQWARQKAPGCKILCFGDSQVKFGVSPQRLEERLGQRTYNLAVCGGQAPSSYFLLRRALESGARPDAIVVDFMPHLLSHGPSQNERQWPELVNIREFVDLTRTTHNASFVAALAIARLVPSVKGRFEIRESILATLGGEPAASRDNLLEYQRIWETHQGALLRRIAPRPPRTYNLSRWEDFPRAWACNPVNAVYLRRFLALAESHGIRVFWLLPPVSPDTQARRERLGIDARYLAFVRQIQSKFANLTVIDGRHRGFDESVFLDPLHLDSRGAAALSAGLAEVIADSRTNAGAGHWVDLPAASKFASDIRNDIPDPSKLALRIQAQARP
jgi:hypothetical protein